MKRLQIALIPLSAPVAAVTSKRGRLARVALAAALAVTLLWLGDHEAQAGTVNPTFTWSVANPVADAPSDITVDFEFPEGDVYSFFWMTFWPAGWQITPSSEVDIGVKRATIEVVNRYGFFNNPCNTDLRLYLGMLNATTDKSQTVTFEDGFDDSNGDGNIDFIDMYPDFNDRILGPAQPIVREVGIEEVGGVKILAQTFIYEPGATIAGRTLDPALGQPMVTVLNNIGDPEAARQLPGDVDDTDDCTPLTATALAFGTAGDGTVLLKSPKETGTYTFSALVVGLRDADGDGYENSLDPCPLAADLDWDPRAASAVGLGDADGDGLPSSCDPDDNDANTDEDGDGYLNRGDNCPLVANGVDQADTPAGTQKDSDLDGIGDACDPNTNNADSEGEAPEALVSQEVTITEAPTPAVETATPTVAPPATLVATPTPAAAPAVPPEEEGDEGFPVWAIIVIVAVVVVGGLGATLVFWGRRAKP